MMKDPQQTIGNMADKYSTALISYIDEEGYPVTKAMLKPENAGELRSSGSPPILLPTKSNAFGRIQRQVFIL